MARRSEEARIARETVSILQLGTYRTETGRTVNLRPLLEQARHGSRLYRPEDFATLSAPCTERLRARAFRTEFEVVNETTLAAAERLLRREDTRRVCALNFASARNPGGGFLNGSRAQEESLARASGLYPCLTRHFAMYEYNRARRTCLYSDHMIYAPDVPVFRADDHRLLEEPYPVSFLTVPAVNAGRLTPAERGELEPVMRGRIDKFLTLAVRHDHETLILGAWGCGVFRNSSVEVARWFHEALTGEGRFARAFSRVSFAIVDWSEERRFIGPFQAQFDAPTFLEDAPQRSPES